MWFLSTVPRNARPQAGRFEAGLHVREGGGSFVHIPRMRSAVRLGIEATVLRKPEDHQVVQIQRQRRRSLHPGAPGFALRFTAALPSRDGELLRRQEPPERRQAEVLQNV